LHVRPAITIMFTISRLFAFIIIYIHSFNFFVALAAPVQVTSETPSVLRKREPGPQQDNGLSTRNVHSRNNNLSNLPTRAVQNPIKLQYPLPSAQREPQALVQRGFWNKIKSGFKKMGNAVKGAVQKVGNGVKKVANGVKHVAQKVGGGVKNAVKKVGNGVKNVVHKVGNGVKKVAQKVGNGVKAAGKWVKANGAKIAKGGLKVLSTVTSVAGRVANFVPIPGLNKAASKALKYASFGLDKGSDAIHADLGKFGSAMKVMDKIQHPFSGVAGAVMEAVLKRDADEEQILHRDLGGFVEEREFDFEDLDL
jgi:gas vesicle protein